MSTLHKGQRVTMTLAALRQRLDGRKKRTTGTVVGWGKTGLVRVRRDGAKEPERYHPTFWRPIQ